MKNCVKGKQFWCKSCIREHGTCMACPPNWGSCYNEHIDDQRRCVDSCRTAKPKPKPAKKTSTSILPTTPTSSFIPSVVQTEIFPTRSIPVVYPSALHPVEAKKYEPRPGNDEHHHMKLGPIVAVSAFSIFGLLAVVVALLFLIRGIRKRSARNRCAESDRSVEERIGLNVIQQNDVEENLPENANDGENKLQPNNAEKQFQAKDIEERQAPEETQPPVHATPPNSIKVGGTQETAEDYCSSSLHLTEVHN